MFLKLEIFNLKSFEVRCGAPLLQIAEETKKTCFWKSIK